MGRDFYVILCGMDRKRDDLYGRIIHDFSFAQLGGKSINASLLEISVEYITFFERVKALSSGNCYVSVL